MTSSDDRIAQDELVQRLRDLLANEADFREVSMFGGRSFMLNNKMIVSALKDGGLLVRVAAGDHEELCRCRASQAHMGKGRSMGPGWIEVDAESITDDVELKFWFDVATARERAEGPG